jgi:hypothetical protein
MKKRGDSCFLRPWVAVIAMETRPLPLKSSAERLTEDQLVLAAGPECVIFRRPWTSRKGIQYQDLK